ncbi:MAG: amidohydrolase [Myxococcales bacterium]|nr:amidohydrolase [Myxococcales bacterium]
MIVDTHVHVVSDDHARYPLRPGGLPGAWYLEAPCTVEEFLALMDASGVDRAVLVQGVGAYTFDNAYTADSARRYPGRFGGVCCVDPNGDDPPGELSRWVRERGIGGVRLFAIGGPGGAEPWLSSDIAEPLWRRASALDAVVVATILASQIEELRAALLRYPDTRVSLDHCGFPPLASAAFAGAEPLLELARLPNLYLKVTTTVLDAAAEHGDPRDFVELLVARFGANRIQWGSDFSQTHDRPYAELVDLARHAFSRLGDGDRDLCLGGTALRLWPQLAGR